MKTKPLDYNMRLFNTVEKFTDYKKKILNNITPYFIHFGYRYNKKR